MKIGKILFVSLFSLAVVLILVLHFTGGGRLRELSKSLVEENIAQLDKIQSKSAESLQSLRQTLVDLNAQSEQFQCQLVESEQHQLAKFVAAQIQGELLAVLASAQTFADSLALQKSASDRQERETDGSSLIIIPATKPLLYLQTRFQRPGSKNTPSTERSEQPEQSKQQK